MNVNKGTAMLLTRAAIRWNGGNMLNAAQAEGFEKKLKAQAGSIMPLLEEGHRLLKEIAFNDKDVIKKFLETEFDPSTEDGAKLILLKEAILNNGDKPLSEDEAKQFEAKYHAETGTGVAFLEEAQKLMRDWAWKDDDLKKKIQDVAFNALSK
jgi:hypothetical protein